MSTGVQISRIFPLISLTSLALSFNEMICGYYLVLSPVKGVVIHPMFPTWGSTGDGSSISTKSHAKVGCTCDTQIQK